MIEKIDKKIQVKNRKCVICTNDLKVSYDLVKLDQFNTKKEVSFYAPSDNCKICKTSVLAPEFNQIQHEASCLAFDVLNAHEIKEIRKSVPWGANNQEFSKILGFGSSTIARYESCASIPSRAHNNILLGIKQSVDFRKNVIEQTDAYKEYLLKKSKKSKRDNIIDFEREKVFIQQKKNDSLNVNQKNAENFINSSFKKKKVIR